MRSLQTRISRKTLAGNPISKQLKREIMKLLYSTIICYLLSSAVLLMAQSRTIKGKVTDDNGSPLAGVSVIEKTAPENGATTNVDGNFSITLKNSDQRIIVSYQGFLSKELTASNNLTIKLETDVKGLEDVVVIGYGRQKKITKTGSIVSITGDNIRQTPSASLQNTLIGKLPGFTSQLRSGMPGGDGAQFFIRGISTFAGSGQPLILVDDIEYSYNQFSRLDANEVESITVLKDAATTAIYGIKGANGVLLVTTKRGKPGKARVNVTNQFAITAPIRTYEYLNAYETALLRNEAATNDFNANRGTFGLPVGTAADSSSLRMFSQKDLDAFKNGTDPYGHPDVDWYNTLFKKQSMMNTTTIDVSGGVEKIKYFISGSYLWQNGLLRSFDSKEDFNNNYYYKRYNFRSNLDLQPIPRLRLLVNMAGSFGEQNRPVHNGPNSTNDPFFELAGFTNLPPFAYPLYNPDGSYGYNPTWIQGHNNLLGRMKHAGYTRSFENIMNLNINGTYDLGLITRGLSIKGTIAYATSNTATRTLSRGDGFPSYNYNPVSGIYTARNILDTRMPLLGLTTSNGTPVRRFNMQGALNYSRKFAAHTISALALFNQTSDVAVSTDASLNNVPAKFRGYTFRVGYDYNQKYLLELNAGYNGTDRFQAKKRYGFFPAVSAGWNLAEEKFISKNLTWLNLFKIRASWGIVGSDDIGSYRYIYQQIYTQTANSYNFGESPNGFTGMFEGQIGNTNVVWEKERKINYGIDFALFNGKLSGTVDLFDNFRYNILTTPATVPVVFGQTVPVMNIGKVSNKGFEADLTYRSYIGKLEYSIKGTYSVAKNKIVEMGEATPLFAWQKRTGKPIGMVGNGLYIFDGFYQGKDDIAASPKPPGTVYTGYLKYKDLDGDGVINANDRAYVGKANLPQTIFGLSTSINYKNFSLNVLFQGAKDYGYRMVAEAIDAFHANLQPVHQRRWQPGSGNRADYPALKLVAYTGLNSANDYPSTYWFIDAWYVRLRSAELSYHLPASVNDRLGLADWRIFINGSNLLTWSNVYKRYNYDPETSSGGTGAGNYPQQRIINFGINLSFK
jgi:TonB-linked SusC/RagA family outer membrane protein